MLKGPCPNHAYPIKYTYKECMKKFLSRGSKKGDGKMRPDPSGDDTK
jgi:hypothetical protein